MWQGQASISEATDEEQVLQEAYEELPPLSLARARLPVLIPNEVRLPEDRPTVGELSPPLVQVKATLRKRIRQVLVSFQGVTG